MDATQKQALAEGRARQLREHRREAIRRVKAYQAWLRSGSKTKRIPAIPSDADYGIYRNATRAREEATR